MEKILEEVGATVERTDGFVFTCSKLNGEQCLFIYHSVVYDHQPLGPTPRCRIVINGQKV